MRFEIGDIVRISKKFTDLEHEKEYPRNTNGEVIRFSDVNNETSYPVKVVFDGVEYPHQNFSEFRETELRLVRRKDAV